MITFAQINIEYQAGLRKYNLTPSRKHVGKAVARRSKKALILHAMNDPVTKVYVMKRMGVLLKRELAVMCSDKVDSFLRSQSATTF